MANARPFLAALGLLLLCGFAAAVPCPSGTDEAAPADQGLPQVCARDAYAVARTGAGEELFAVSGGVNDLPTTYNMRNGFLCVVILKNYGTRCFNDGPLHVALQLRAQNGTATGGRVVRFNGQDGPCGLGLGFLEVAGLGAQSTILARDLYDGEMRNCHLEETKAHLFMSALWIGLQMFLVLLLVIALIITAIPSLTAYFIAFAILSGWFSGK